jgi:hypothetical protein
MNEAIEKPDWEKIDRLEGAMLELSRGGALSPVELPLQHRFTPGLYTREIFMPAGTLLTSKIHKTEHPYVVLTGRASVFIPGEGVEEVVAPHVGITKPGTRRVLLIHEDCRWVTFHPNPENLETVEEIEDEIIERRELADGKTANELYQDMLDEVVRLTPGAEEMVGAP